MKKLDFRERFVIDEAIRFWKKALLSDIERAEKENKVHIFSKEYVEQEVNNALQSIDELTKKRVLKTKSK